MVNMSTHHPLAPGSKSKNMGKGFTLIELLVVLAIMATLMSIVAPRYFDSLDRAKEATLKTNLRIVRESIDKYRADTGKYPETLTLLVEGKYIHDLPEDPFTERNDTWTVVLPPNGMTSGVYDIHSGAQGVGRNGKPLSQW
jgi:general secretion pathway protein G